MRIKTLGRCPDCGAPAPVVAVRGRPTEILEHGCQARACESSGCLVIRPSDEMIQFPSGEWYCASHALLCAARTLVSLRQNGHSQDLISVLLDETVPAVLDRFPR
jgi:hypothetical protein